jgi:hypothetical protein
MHEHRNRHSCGDHPVLKSWEIPRLCRGGSNSLTLPAVCAPACRSREEKQHSGARPLTLSRSAPISALTRSTSKAKIYLGFDYHHAARGRSRGISHPNASLVEDHRLRAGAAAHPGNKDRLRPTSYKLKRQQVPLAQFSPPPRIFARPRRTADVGKCSLKELVATGGPVQPRSRAGDGAPSGA